MLDFQLSPWGEEEQKKEILAVKKSLKKMNRIQRAEFHLLYESQDTVGHPTVALTQRTREKNKIKEEKRSTIRSSRKKVSLRRLVPASTAGKSQLKNQRRVLMELCLDKSKKER